MARYLTSVTSPWTPEEAFDYVADFRNLIEWDPSVTASTITSGDKPGVGTVYAVTASGATLDYVTQVYERPNRFVVEGASKQFYSYDVIEFASTDSGCLVSYDATLKLRGVLSAFTPGLGLFFDRIGDKAAGGLAKALEGTITS